MNSPETHSSRCPLFQDMSLTERQHVLELLEHQSFPSGETILREGRSIQILWIVVHGRCRVVKGMDDGEQELAILEPGSVFGEVSFFHPAPHSASVQTLTDVEVMRLSRENYDQLVERDPSAARRIATNVVAVLAERLRRMDDWMADLVQRPDTADKHREEWREFRSKLYTDWEF